MEEASFTPAGPEEEAEARPLLPRRGQLPVAAVSLEENDAYPASRLPARQLQSPAGKVIDKENVCAENAAGRRAAFNVELSEAVSAQEWGRHASRGGGEDDDRPPLLARVPLNSETTVSCKLDPGLELEPYVASQPAQLSPASAGGAVGFEACSEDNSHTGRWSVSPYLLSTISAKSSTSAPCLSPSGCPSASSTTEVSVATGPFLYAWRARRVPPKVQTPVQGLQLPQSAGETTVSAIAYNKLSHTAHERTITATAATKQASKTFAASGGAVAGEPDGEHRVVNPHSVDDATICETVVVCERNIDTDCGSGSVSRRKIQEVTAARRRGTALVPQGFSLAHVPAGFLWGRTRLGALRLVYKSAGTPDCVVLVGPNWNFALAMFFLHVLVVAFFLYVFLTAFKDWSPFAGGLILCLVTFYGFLSTVFKDPGLPLNVSLVELQPRLLSSATARLRVQDASSRQVQRRLPGVLRGVRRPWRFKESSLRRQRKAVVGLFVKKREFHCGSSSFDGKPDTSAAETGARGERRTWWSSSHGTYTAHSTRSAGFSAEGWGTAGQSGDSRDADATTDGSRNSSISAEEMSAFDGETRQPFDEEGGDEVCTTETTLRSTRMNRSRRVPEGPLRTKRLLLVSLRAKEGLSASTSANRSSQENDRRLLSYAPSAFITRNIGDRRSLLRKKGGTAMTSAPQALGRTFNNLTGLRAQFSSVREGRRHMRRRRLVGPPARIGSDGIHWCRVAGVDPNSFSADAHPKASQAAPVVQQSQHPRQVLARKHSRKNRGHEVEFSPLHNRPRTYDRGGRRAEGCESDTMHTPFCAVCGIAPPPGAYHCDECRVCIEGYDHHCPWTSKCVGKGNSKEFYTWVVFALVTIIYFGMVTTLLRKEDDAHGAGTETRDASDS